MTIKTGFTEIYVNLCRSFKNSELSQDSFNMKTVLETLECIHFNPHITKMLYSHKMFRNFVQAFFCTLYDLYDNQAELAPKCIACFLNP